MHLPNITPPSYTVSYLGRIEVEISFDIYILDKKIMPRCNRNFMKEGTYYGRNKWFEAY